MRTRSTFVTVWLLAIPQFASAQLLAHQRAVESLNLPLRMKVICSIQAATRFALPADLMIAVAETEGGQVGQWVRNKNGSYDVGPMQINTTYLTSLERFGITPRDAAADGCYPYELAAWRLRRHLTRDDGDLWTRAANYHSRTPIHNARYRTAIRARATKWARWLSVHAPSTKIAALDVATIASPIGRKHRENGHLVRIASVRRSPKSNEQHCSALGRSSSSAEEAIGTGTNVIEILAAIEANRREQLLQMLYGALSRSLGSK